MIEPKEHENCEECGKCIDIEADKELMAEVFGTSTPEVVVDEFDDDDDEFEEDDDVVGYF